MSGPYSEFFSLDTRSCHKSRQKPALKKRPHAILTLSFVDQPASPAGALHVVALQEIARIVLHAIATALRTFPNISAKDQPIPGPGSSKNSKHHRRLHQNLSRYTKTYLHLAWAYAMADPRPAVIAGGQLRCALTETCYNPTKKLSGNNRGGRYISF